MTVNQANIVNATAITTRGLVTLDLSALADSDMMLLDMVA